MKKILIYFIFGIIISFILNPVAAQTTLPIQVSPTRQEISIYPGEQTGFKVKFFNLSETPIYGILKVADFTVEADGRPRIIDNIELAPPKYAASNWIDLPYDTITIAAQDKVTVQGKIIVPQNAGPGGRYAAIYFEPTTEFPKSIGVRQEAGAAITARIASLIYLKIPGDYQENASLSKYFAPSFFEYGPVKVETDILNLGDYHIRPKGVVILTNMMGQLVGQESLKEQNIFPNSARSYQSIIGQKWMFGRYRAEINASYGEKGRVLKNFIYIWVFPWKVATIILLTLLILVLLGRNVYKNVVIKETKLEDEVKKEKEEIEKLKAELRKKRE